MKTILAATAAATLLASVCGHAGAETSPTAKAVLRNLKGAPVGTASLVQMPEGVMIKVELAGVRAGVHGFHIHATGKCEPPFASAGGHFNPGGHHHGFGSAAGYHAGDLPNVDVGSDGKAVAEVFAAGVTLDNGPAGLFGPDGTALVLHAAADDYRTDPSGNSGDRIACGVIGR